MQMQPTPSLTANPIRSVVLFLVLSIDPSFPSAHSRSNWYSSWYRCALRGTGALLGTVAVVLGVAAPDRFLVNVGEIYWFVAKDQFTRNYGVVVAAVVACCSGFLK